MKGGKRRVAEGWKNVVIEEGKSKGVTGGQRHVTNIVQRNVIDARSNTEGHMEDEMTVLTQQ